MRDWYRSISARTALIFILLNILVVGTFSVILYRHFLYTTRQSVEESLNATIAANNNRSRDLLNRIEITTDLVHDSDVIYRDTDTELPDILNMIVTFEERGDNSHLVSYLGDYKRNKALFNNYFKTCFGENESVYGNVLFVDDSWPVHRYMRGLSDPITEKGFSSNRLVKEEDWYQRAREADGKPYWFTMGEDKTMLCMARLLKYRHIEAVMTGREYELGVLVVCFDSSILSGYLERNGLTKDSQIFLMDDTDTVIYSTDRDKMGTVSHELSQMAGQEQVEWDYEGERCMISRAGLPLDLSVVTIVPVSEVSRMASQGIRIIVLAGIAALLVGIVATVLISTAVLTPLKEFAAYMEAGDTVRFPFDLERRDEIGRLYRSFCHLLCQLKETMQRETEAQEHKAQAELRALQAQINPHFIYNTLNSISCLSMLNGQEYIAELIGNLTKVIRYNISNPLELVAVSEELDIIRQYEHIQKNCYRERLTFAYRVDPLTLDCMIPKLIIQPLVENAVLHGMSSQEKTLRILLAVSIREQDLLIRVQDSGKEADTDQINRYAAGQEESRTKSLGVRNVFERLQLVYGTKGVLCYRKDETGCTVAEIQIPGAVSSDRFP